MDVSAGRVIADKYEVLGVLGEGGTGVVYDAIRTEDRRPVAVKVMHATLAGDAQIRGRFAREAAILRRLEGQHVSPILDFGEVPGTADGTTLLYIALPKIEGESLAALLERGLVDVDRALDIFVQVLEALTVAHGQGIIHRDLKPANVLLEGGSKVVVVDFGLAKIITGGGTGTTNLTTHNMLFGTPEYMSPEQARGDELDARCDLYAAGVILYELLTGTPPFSGASPLVVLTAHLTSDVEPPSSRTPTPGRVTPALEAVVLRALARDREQRYPSASAFAVALEEARRASGTAFARTLPQATVDVDVTAPTLISDRPAVSPRPARESAKPSRPPPSRVSTRPPLEPEPKADSRGWIVAWIIVALASVAVGVWFALRR